ncbi:dihydrodipicolinate synthase family protein [Skermanella sp. TT6]|uniref:Dihydrodipicolinate synthase family protein n=1 Tax=Skermanella cutis TaxID=2775420 RepID=A0ABX7B053_9PROT|nr:dihydrodipicolinate synthase family protein [Skermanella sp. TT6]QQP87638.1 dihydrodipicolinate synthase family protein [Skermanella sp. TT6]
MGEKLNERANGVYIIAATPFEDDGRLDLASTDRMVDFYLECGVDGMTILGIMGEAPKLTPDEQQGFMRRVFDRIAGRIPVIVGVSNPGTNNLAAFAHSAMDAGAAGVMIAPMSGLKTEEQVVNYFAETLRILGPEVPVVFQDYPQVTQVPVSVATLRRIFDDHPQIVMLKHEDAPGLRKLGQIRTWPDTGGRRISILVGNGGLHLPQELRRGADGAMTGFAYPEMLVQVCRRFFAGDADGAEDLFDTYLPIVRHEQQAGIGLAIRKEILRRRGVLASAAVRAPGPKLNADDHKELDSLMARLEAKLGG